MSTRWAYTNNKRNIGHIETIYCSENPTDANPTGIWLVVFENNLSMELHKLTESHLYTQQDKNAYNNALINSDEVARKYIEKKNKKCILM